ncbi:MAG: ubiquinone biosynthesis hydroxylase [Salaquimonas sp.]|jgi:2-octaprenyl-6-methoxyphenol hydroxylase|nr:ubiquinone biosynthesis hydroxylase [Salaquimonas sp.]
MARQTTRRATKKSSDNTVADETDVLIAGGGYVGLCTAVAIRGAAPTLSVTIVDPVPAEAIEKDVRASAIAAAATRMLERLGVWAELVADAQPINEMIVTDSRLSDATRPVFLTFANDRTGGEPGGEQTPFAHMLPNRSLVKALRAKAEALGVALVTNTVEGFSVGPASVDICLGKGAASAKLLIAADGVRSKLREAAGIRTLHWPYEQMGIVVTVAHERPHEGRAEEHFLPAGPFAILPLKDNRSSLVWTERTADARRLMEADDITFELELEQRFGHKLGAITVEGPRRAFPLGLTLARDTVQERFALAGDAAHGIHPIAGQGLNLGFKDAAALSETIVEAHRLGLDIGSLAVLERYQQWRRFDTVQMGVTTDVLNRLFSNNNPLLRTMRDTGLGLVDRLPGLKRRFIDQAAGYGSGTPRLLQGEAI